MLLWQEQLQVDLAVRSALGSVWAGIGGGKAWILAGGNCSAAAHMVTTFHSQLLGVSG
jgi:hypothetical protein